MIQQTTAYRVGELVFPTIQEAQIKELTELLGDGGVLTDAAASIVKQVVAHTDEVVEILTCQPKASAPRKPRADKGVPRKKKAAPMPVGRNAPSDV